MQIPLSLRARSRKRRKQPRVDLRAVEPVLYSTLFRKAFKETLRDPEFLAETKKSKLLIKHIVGKEIEKIVNSILAIPPAAKKRLQFLLK